MNTNRLQLLRHAEVLPNYEALQRFLLMNYIKEAKNGEPFVLFYQAGDEVRMVLAIGNTESEYGCDLIDFKSVEAKVAELSDKVDELSDEVKAVVEAVEAIKADLEKEIQERIDADVAEAIAREEMDALLAKLCGFVMNEKSGEFEYVHDAKDEIIGDAETLAEAIDLLSKFVQDNNITYTFEKSKSVRFIVEEDGTERKIKAEVVLSKTDRDEDSHDDNILVKYEDGLAATIDLHYDEDKKALAFTRSCTATGKHKTTYIELPFKGLADSIAEVKTSLEKETTARTAKDAELEAKDATLETAIATTKDELLGHEDAGKDEISIYGVRNRVDELVTKAQETADKALEDAKKYADKAVAAEKAERVSEDEILNKAIDDEADARSKKDAELEQTISDDKKELLGNEKDGKDEVSIYGVRNRVDEVAKDATKAADKALADAKKYADEAIAGADIAGAADKALEDAKKYADEKDNAVKADLAKEIERAKAAEKRALIVEVKDGKGVDLTRSIDDDGTVLEAEVKLSGLNKNILSLKEDGLYAPEVQVEYDGVTNTITFKMGESETSYQLAGMTAVNDLRYDPESKNLIFSITDDKGDKKDVNVYLGDLVPSIMSGSTAESPIKINIEKDTDKKGQFIATVTAELNNVWDKDIKADFHVDTTDADGTVIATEKLENVHQVLQHLLNRVEKAFEIIRKFQNLTINGIKPYDDEHNGVMELKGSDIMVGGDGEHKEDTIDKAIEDLYEEVASIALPEVKVKDDEENKYLGLEKTVDAEDNHEIYTLDAKVVKLDDVDDDNTGLADAKDVKDAIDEAIEIAIASGTEIKVDDETYVGIEKEISEEDGHPIYTIKPQVVKLEDASDDNTGIADTNDVKKAIDEAIEIAIASGTEVEVKDGEDNKYLAIEESADSTDEHRTYTLDAKVVKLDEASDDNTGVADANDVKKAIDEAIEIAVASGTVVVEGDGTTVSVEEAEDGHKEYTVEVKIDEDTEDYLSVSEKGVKVSGLDDKFEVIAAAFNNLNERVNAGKDGIDDINKKIDDMDFTDSVSSTPAVVVKVSQEDGKIDVAKRSLNGTVDNGADGKSVINFTITDTQIIADIEIIDCGEF